MTLHRCDYCGADCYPLYQLEGKTYSRCVRCGRTGPNGENRWPISIACFAAAGIWTAIVYFFGGC